MKRGRAAFPWLGLMVIAMACTQGGGPGATPNPPESIRVSSAAFESGRPIPSQFTCDGGDVSPPLSWGGGFAVGGPSLLLVQDPDAPGGPFVHWVVYLPGTVTSLEEGRLPAGAVQGTNDFGDTGYSGPCPPPGDQPHHYQFTVFALRPGAPAISPGQSADEALDAVRGSAQAKGTLVGTYARA